MNRTAPTPGTPVDIDGVTGTVVAVRTSGLGVLAAKPDGTEWFGEPFMSFDPYADRWVRKEPDWDRITWTATAHTRDA